MADLHEVKDYADTLLHYLSDLVKTLAIIESQAAAAMKQVTDEYGPKAQKIMDAIALREKELLTLAKKNRKDLFGDGDLLELAYGLLIYSKADKVTIPKNGIEKAEEHGFTEVIKIVKSLDREAVEKWPDEKLFLIGAKRKPAEEYSYEIKAQDGTKRQKTKLGGKKRK